MTIARIRSPCAPRVASALNLRAIKVVHTVAWALFAAAIVALPVLGWRRQFRWAAAAEGFVLLECIVLAVNRCRCPLTNVAERFTQERGPNFDIYLPAWLARYNKPIFGTLFVAGSAVAVWRWFATA